jgi:hypothetical protein
MDAVMKKRKQPKSKAAKVRCGVVRSVPLAAADVGRLHLMR